MASSKNKEDGNKIGFGGKSQSFLEKKSRQAVEQYTDTFVLFFEIDYENSQRNFYGEILTPKWKQSLGVKLHGTIKVADTGEAYLEQLPNRLLALTFSCYVSHLKEVGVWPQIGDFFSIKNRFYYITEKTLLDSNKHAIISTEEAIAIEFKCTEADNEMFSFSHLDPQNVGNYNQILGKEKK